MNYILELNTVFVLFSSSCSTGVNVEIDGNINLGPKWSYEFQPLRIDRDRSSKLERKRMTEIPDVVSKMLEKYAPKYEADDIMNQMFVDTFASTNKKLNKNIEPYNDMELHATSTDTVQDVNESTVHKKVTKPFEQVKNSEIFVQPRKVKHDSHITEFTKHIYKQSLKVFDAIKEKATDEIIKKEIDFLARSYEEKFGEFVRETQNQQIKTRLGRRKVIMNTLETSNLILKRLVNYLVGMDKNILRSEATANVFQNEVKKKMETENTHICKKFGICRSQDGFTNFVIDLINIALTANDKQIKTLSDALTETMKYADFSHVMNLSTEKHFNKGIADMETYEVTLLKPILYIIKNVMVNKNKPIEVIGEIDKRVNKTVGVLEMVDALENALPPNEKNRLEWGDIKNSLKEWRDGKRHDIVEITQSFINHVNKGLDTFGEKTSQNFEQNINLILGFL